ncbi:MAG: hypothetical protein KDD58_15600 [Bdellovibrionales bacterium]|nr:hypothetical protein [Bdellovibrionales bacterium]
MGKNLSLFVVVFWSCLTSAKLGQETEDLVKACQILCSTECKQLKNDLRVSIKNIDDSCTDSPHNSGVKIYNSDSCSNNLLVALTPFSDCEDLSSTGTEAWGVEVNGVCHNVPDTNLKDACFNFKAASAPNSVVIYNSDSCSSSKAMAYVNAASKCGELSNQGTQAWAVEVNGECRNFTDVSVQQACINFKSAHARAAVEAYHSDSCMPSGLIAVYSPRSKCDDFPGSGSDVWAIKINGKCENLSDMSLREACNRFKGSNF